MKRLLITDAVVNLLLGVLLLLFPSGLVRALGIPVPLSPFYPSILGAVLLGIGIALTVEVFGGPHGARGLGATGAIVINFCGAGALTLWLCSSALHLPLRGYILLGALAFAVFAVGGAEIFLTLRGKK